MNAFIQCSPGVHAMFSSRTLPTNERKLSQRDNLRPRARPRGRTHAHPATTTTMIRGFPNNFPERGSSENAGRSWDHLVDFPCVFTFKVIGMAQGDFVNDIVDSVASALEMDRKFLKTSYRDRGKYRSITLEAPVNTSAQIFDVYAAIDRDPRVKFKF